MIELELKLSLPDEIANQAKAAGLLTSESIERLMREAIRKVAAQRLIEYGKRLREPGGPEITEAELEIELKYHEGRPVIRELKRVSKPGRRVYASVRELKPHRQGLGVSIVSTPHGVMTDANAREKNVGGEVLCHVF